VKQRGAGKEIDDAVSMQYYFVMHKRTF